MVCHRSSGRIVTVLNIPWKLAILLALVGAQLGVLPGTVDQALAAPDRQPVQPAPLFSAPAPSVSVSAGSVMLGSNFTITATFSSAGDTGYGPFIDLYIPRTGADGVYPGTSISNQYDGIFASAPVHPLNPDSPGADFTATYQGSALTVYTSTFPNSGGGTGCVTHPLALDSSGNFLQVCGKAGDQLVTVVLPFGSYTTGQPPISIAIPAYLSPLADVGPTALAIRARSGFQFGATPMVDWCCGIHDTTIVSDASTNGSSWAAHGSLTPSLFTFKKTGMADTATGPNYPQTYTLTLDVAAGQTVTGINITDPLPVYDGPGGKHNVYYDDHLTYTAGGTVTHQPAPGIYDSESIQLHYGSVTGPGSGDAIVVSFQYYLPQFDAGSSDVVPAQTGIPTSTENDASIQATWVPVDTRDLPQPVSATGVGTGTNRALKVSKDGAIVVDTGPSGTSPNDIIQYTITADVSDYFALDAITAQDTIADGQHFYTDATHLPQLVVTENGGSSTLTYGPSNYLVTCNYSYPAPPPPLPAECNADNPAANDGSTRVDFNVSAELGAHGLSPQVLGGLVPDGGSLNDGQSSIQIIFFTKVLDHYTDQHSGTDLKQGDVLDDSASVTGSLLDIGTCSSGTCSASYPGNPAVSDSGSAGVTVPEGSLSKSIYAVNGATCGSCQNVQVAPGDTMTYRLTYNLVMGDYSNLSLTDFLPLPVFKSDDPDADGVTGPTWSEDTINLIPDAGKWRLGPADTRGNLPADPPTVSGASANNSVTFVFGSYDDPANQPKVIDLLFTVTVSHDPFADSLQMTNQAQEGDYNSSPTISTTSKINQFTLTEPVLVSKKSAVSTDHPGVTPSPAISAPVVFSLPGDTVNPPWNTATPINSSYLAAHPINSAISGVDGGDMVKFAIVVENTGSGLNGAFDMIIQDSLPSGYVLPNLGAENINLQVYRGDGTALGYVNAGGGSGLLDQGIQITDDGPSTDHPYGFGACQAHDLASGKNVVLITYDLKVDANVAPGQLIENHGQLTHYSGSEGGPNYLPTPQVDTSDTTIAALSLAKDLVGTSIDSSASNNSKTQVVIGEHAQYSLTMTVPEGVSPSTVLTDVLPAGLAFVSADSFVNSDPAHLSFSGSSTPSPDITGHILTINLGTVTNTDVNNNVAETLIWKYTVVVLNVIGNQAGQTLTNSAAVNWDSFDQTGAVVHKSVANIHAPAITVIEPNVDISKTVVPASGDAADPFTYTITISGATVTDAFDVTLSDTIPAQMQSLALTAVTDTAGQVTLSNFNLTGNTLTTTHPFDMPFSPSRTITLTLTGSVSYIANPAQTINNSAIVRWTSLPGADAHERTGADGVGGALNDYAKAGTALFTVTSVGATKIFINTSEAHTPDSPLPPRVAVGEIVRYRLVVPIPEGTSPNFQVRDNLPTGMIFLNDSTARLAFVSNGPGITSSAVGIVPAITGSCTFNGASVDASTPADPLPCSFAPQNIGSDNSISTDTDNYVSGTAVYFKFGDLVNNDNDSDTEFVVLEFNAIVDNSPAGGNVDGKSLTNSFTVFVNGSTNGPLSNTITVQVVEPALSIGKIASPATGDAGDAITYTLSISNTGHTTAFDVQVTDSTPAGITVVSSKPTVSDPTNCASGLDNSHSSGNTTDVRFSAIPANCSLTISYTAVVDYTVTASQVLPNTAHVVSTSLPGNNGTITNPTGSSTPGASGTDTGERIYSGQVSASFTIHPVVPTKSIVATSDPNTLGNNLAIGEVLRYRLAVVIPEGTQQGFTMDDILPAGLSYVGNPAISFTDDAGMTLAPGLAGADHGPVPPVFVLPAGFVAVNGQHITFALGDIVNNDSDPGAESVTLEFDVLVNNDANNHNTNTKDNSFTVTIANVLRGTSNTVTATIVEPVLTVNKVISHIDVTRDAGDTVTYQVTIAPDLRSVPGSTAYAYDVHFTDALPGDLTLDVSSVSAVLNGSATVFTNSSSGNSVDITVGTIPNTPGTSVVLTFNATLKISVTPGELIRNTGDLTWTSLAGLNANERDGSLTPAFNNYHAQSSASFNVHDPVFSKSLMFSSEGTTADPNLTIGEVATFGLLVTLPEGTTPALHISDDIPLGLQVVPGSASIITTAADSHGLMSEDFNGTLSAMAVAITSPGNSGDDIAFDFSNPITVAEDLVSDSNNNSFVISFQAVVNNLAGNQAGITLPNSATMTVGSWNSGPSVANVQVVEPKLIVQKTVDNDHPRLGDTITYTTTIQYDPASTADAFNLVVTDTLPAGLVNPSGLTASSPADCAGVPDTGHSSGATVEVRIVHLPVGCILTVSYQSSIDPVPPNTPAIGTVITNAAHLTWTSLPAVNGDVRTGSGSSPNTYFADSIAPVTFANIDMVISKSDGGVTATPGSSLVYTLHYQNAGNIQATGVLITEVVPQYATFNAGSSAPGWSCPDGSAAGTTCTFGIASVDASTSGNVLFVVNLDASVPDLVVSIVNTASITDDHSHGNEPTPLNNTSTATTPLNAAPDIAVAKTDGLDTVAPGESLPYVLMVTNTGNQDATGVVVTDTLPAQTTFVSAGTNPAGQPAAYDSSTGVVSWPVFDLAAGSSITLTVYVTVNDPLPAGITSLINTALAHDDATNGPDLTPADNTARDVDNVLSGANSDLTKTLIVDSLGATVNPDVAVGEVLTYHITFNVPPGWMDSLVLTDQLDLGLSLVDCESITASSSFLTWQDPPAAEATDFTPICSSPVVSAVGDPANPASSGRQAVFDFHNLHNSDSQTHSITLSIHAVVLDVVENQSGRNDLNNAATLAWNGGSLMTSSPTPQQVVEPKLTLSKTGDRDTTYAGGVVTFTLTLAYDPATSTAEAYDVVLTDVLPPGLTYLPHSLQYVSGNLPNSAVPPSLDDSAAPTLRVFWDAFPSTPVGNSVVQFQATLGDIGPGNSVTNTAHVEWTSLPGIPPSPPHIPPLPAGQESIYNDTSHERRYDPLHPADVYGVSAAFSISIPSLPKTGFAPNRSTSLPEQPKAALYSDLGVLWVEIPSLNVKADIVGVPAASGAWDLTWLGDQIGYLYGTAYPTWSGNTGLTGHVYLANGKPGPFVNLHNMIWGQQIIIHMDGEQYLYEVRSIRRVLPDDLSVLGHADLPTLTLITCQGYDQANNDYLYRIAVQAVLVKIMPEK